MQLWKYNIPADYFPTIISPLLHFTTIATIFYLNVSDSVLGEGEQKRDINTTAAAIELWKRQHWERSGETGVAEGGIEGKFPSHLVLAEEEWVILWSATMLNDFSFPLRIEGQLR